MSECVCVCVPCTLCVSVRQFHCVGELLRHVHAYVHVCVCVCVSYSFSIRYNSSGYVMDKDDDYKIKECITLKNSVTK